MQCSPKPGSRFRKEPVAADLAVAAAVVVVDCALDTVVVPRDHSNSLRFVGRHRCDYYYCNFRSAVADSDLHCCFHIDNDCCCYRAAPASEAVVLPVAVEANRFEVAEAEEEG